MHRFRRFPLWLLAVCWLFLFSLGATPDVHAAILAAQFFDSSVARLSETTGLPVPGSQIPSGSAGLAGASGLALGPDGAIYVSSQFTGEILFFDGETGAPHPSPQPGGRDGLFASLGSNATPGLLRFGPDGDLYVADTGNENVRIVDGMSGDLLGNAVNGDALQAPGFTIGFGFAPNGDLLVGRSSPLFEGSILRVDSAGDAVEIVAPGTAGLQSISSLLVGPSGELYATDLFGNQIVRFDDIDGSNPQRFAVIPPEIEFPLPIGAGFPSNFPSDLALDAGGQLVVGTLGLTNPANGGDNRGSLLRYDLEGNLLQTIVSHSQPVGAIALTPGPVCDLDGDGSCGISDLDALVGAIASGSSDLSFDLDGDGVLGQGDISEWLSVAGGEQLGPGLAYLEGDANLDAVVDVSDFNLWNEHKFAATGRWSQADFNADGTSDVSDFNVWNTNKFASSTPASVPEPSAGVALWLALVWLPAIFPGSSRLRAAPCRRADHEGTPHA